MQNALARAVTKPPSITTSLLSSDQSTVITIKNYDNDENDDGDATILTTDVAMRLR